MHKNYALEYVSKGKENSMLSGTKKESRVMSYRTVDSAVHCYIDGRAKITIGH